MRLDEGSCLRLAITHASVWGIMSPCWFPILRCFLLRSAMAASGGMGHIAQGSRPSFSAVDLDHPHDDQCAAGNRSPDRTP